MKRHSGIDPVWILVLLQHATGELRAARFGRPEPKFVPCAVPGVVLLLMILTALVLTLISGANDPATKARINNYYILVET